MMNFIRSGSVETPSHIKLNMMLFPWFRLLFEPSNFLEAYAVDTIESQLIPCCAQVL